MTDIIGYLALGTGLFAINKKEMFSLRLWHLASSVLYLTYGLFLHAYPVITSGTLFISIHLYNLNKIIKQKKVNPETALYNGKRDTKGT